MGTIFYVRVRDGSTSTGVFAGSIDVESKDESVNVSLPAGKRYGDNEISNMPEKLRKEADDLVSIQQHRVDFAKSDSRGVARNLMISASAMTSKPALTGDRSRTGTGGRRAGPSAKKERAGANSTDTDVPSPARNNNQQDKPAASPSSHKKPTPRRAARRESATSEDSPVGTNSTVEAPERPSDADKKINNEIAKSSVKALRRKALSAGHRGNYEMAAKLLEGALAKTESGEDVRSDILLGLGGLYLENLGKPRKTESYYKQFLDHWSADPAAPAVRNKLCRLTNRPDLRAKYNCSQKN
jgi:tetratricopeptide (TPR) repeat protein